MQRPIFGNCLRNHLLHLRFVTQFRRYEKRLPAGISQRLYSCLATFNSGSDRRRFPLGNRQFGDGADRYHCCRQ